MGGLIVDASIIGNVVLPDEVAKNAPRLAGLIKTGDLHAPGNFRIEVASLIRRAWRRGRISGEQVQAALATADTLTARVRLDATASSVSISNCADRYRLSTYDAAYVELALRLRGRVLTADGSMFDAAKRLDILA